MVQYYIGIAGKGLVCKCEKDNIICRTPQETLVTPTPEKIIHMPCVQNAKPYEEQSPVKNSYYSFCENHQ